jgi:hypothetical protein
MSDRGLAEVTMKRKLLGAVAIWALLGGACIAAQPDNSAQITPTAAKAVRAVVQAQLDAFALDDAAKAFSFASPEIRKQFGDAATFMNMVRQGYPMVIRPATVSYFRPENRGGAVWQMVQLRDQGGQIWRAVYELRLQPDKRWRINGCVVVPDDERSTT